MFAVDDAGARLPPGETGALCRRHTSEPRLFDYHGDAGEDRAARTSDDPGAFTLGDIGRVDADGYVYLADRESNMIISGGVNIYPAEIEHVLVEHPAVADVGVFGIPDDEWGERVKAAVELAAGLRAGARARGRDPGLRPRAPRRLQGAALDRLRGASCRARPPASSTVRVLRDRYWEGRERHGSVR